MGSFGHNLNRHLDVEAVCRFEPRSALIDVGLDRVWSFDQLRPWVDLVYPCASGLFPKLVSVEVGLARSYSPTKFDAWQVFRVVLQSCLVVGLRIEIR